MNKKMITSIIKEWFGFCWVLLYFSAYPEGSKHNVVSAKPQHIGWKYIEKQQPFCKGEKINPVLQSLMV